MAVKVASAIENAPVAKVVALLSNGQKVKERLLKMRACNERNEKGQLCTGHLKRWFGYDDEIQRKFGDEIYRCEHCRTLYLPNPNEEPHTGTLAF